MLLMVSATGGEWHLAEYRGVRRRFLIRHQQWTLGHRTQRHTDVEATRPQAHRSLRTGDERVKLRTILLSVLLNL